MKFASRHLRSPAPAIAAVASLGALLLLSACSGAGGSSKQADSSAPIYLAPLHTELGRVLSYDAKAGAALVEFAPFAKIPAPLAGQNLIARHPDTLVQTAKLVASTHRTGSVFAAYVLEGTPSPNDEVVIPPASEKNETATGAGAATMPPAPTL